jgi:hypothetical protein
MTRCNHCGANNMDGSEYCDECGTKLTPAEAPLPRQSSAPPEQFITQVAPPPSPSFTKDNVTPKPATPYTPPPPPSRPSSGDSADRPPGRGADRARDQGSARASDSALKPAASSTPPAASQAANFQPPPNIAETGAHRTQGSGQPPNQTGAFNGQTNALRGGGDSEGVRHLASSDEKSRPSPPAVGQSR